MKKFLWIAALVIAGAYFGKQIIRMLENIPVIGPFFVTKDNADFTKP